jgi:hypothetical protein
VAAYASFASTRRNEMNTPDHSAHAEREIPLLREELHKLKGCQITFLTTAFTATGALFGLIKFLPSEGHAALGYLVPLVVILPAFCFFFDKARTITRIVGYYRILENILNKSATMKEFPGWENALALKREHEFPSADEGLSFKERFNRFKERLKEFRQVSLTKKGFKRFAERFLRFLPVFVTRPPHAYWSMGYWTFSLLALLCIGISWYGAHTTAPPSVVGFRLLYLAIGIAAVAWCRNLVGLWKLTVGRNSYEANYEFWRERLNVTKVTDSGVQPLGGGLGDRATRAESRMETIR